MSLSSRSLPARSSCRLAALPFHGRARGSRAGLYFAAYLAGGFDVARHAWHSLKTGRFDTDLLMVTAALGAAAIGEAADGALLLFLFSLGHALEELALDRARQAVSKLGRSRPRRLSCGARGARPRFQSRP